MKLVILISVLMGCNLMVRSNCCIYFGDGLFFILCIMWLVKWGYVVVVLLVNLSLIDIGYGKIFLIGVILGVISLFKLVVVKFLVMLEIVSVFGWLGVILKLIIVLLRLSVIVVVFLMGVLVDNLMMFLCCLESFNFFLEYIILFDLIFWIFVLVRVRLIFGI